MAEPSTNRGRPRDPAIDRAILTETRRLLAETGFAATTIHEISRRTGIHPPGIYRRWPNRIALIEDAAFSDLATVAIEPTGNLRADLRRFLRAYEASLDSPAARAAMPGLIAAYGADAKPPVDRWVHLSVRPQLAAILAASDDSDPAIDADEAFELVLSLVLARLIIPPLAASRRPIDRVVELVLRVVQRR
jgi:AcrR family transcriptional regulator